MAKCVRGQAWIYFALIGNVCDNGVFEARLNPAHDDMRLVASMAVTARMGILLNSKLSRWLNVSVSRLGYILH